MSEPKRIALPHNREAEQHLLRTILRNPSALADVAGSISVEDLYLPAHRQVFSAMTELQERGEKPDLVTVAALLQGSIAIVEAGGMGYLADLFSDSPSAADYRQYAKIIRDESTKRKILALKAITDRASMPGESVQELLADLENGITQVIETGARADTKHVAESVAETWAVLDERRNRGDAYTGVPSGFAGIDELTAGFKAGELVIVAARPSVGKTAIAVNIARHVAISEKVPTLFVSLEQSRVELTERFLCCQGLIDSHRLKTGRLRPDETDRIFTAGDALTRSGLFIDDAPGQTILHICANARRMKRLHGIGLIVIDYLQLVLPDGKKDNRQEQVAAMSRRLKLLARELAIPVIVLAQLNRESERRGGDCRPKLSDLRESGAIEQDADVVILLHRPVDDRGQSDGIMEVIIAKHRNGPTGIAPLLYIKQHMRFTNYTVQTAGEFVLAWNNQTEKEIAL